MSPEEFLAILDEHGWGPIQAAIHCGYDKDTGRWWIRHRSIPPEVAAWAAALPRIPRSPLYSATSTGLRRYLARGGMTCREVAEFCGVAEQTVGRWATNYRPLPLPMRAWLRAGAPPIWQWDPGLPPGEGTMRCRSKPPGVAKVRGAPQQRYIGSIVVSMFRKYGHSRHPRPAVKERSL